jgi:hypothetical protein
VDLRVCTRVGAIALAIFCVTAIPARAQRSSEANYLTSVNTMLGRLAPASKESALAIRDSYRPFLDLLALDDFNQIEAGLANGGLVPLPSDPERFNVRVRLDGLSPIGEMDMSRQASYVSARARPRSGACSTWRRGSSRARSRSPVSCVISVTSSNCARQTSTRPTMCRRMRLEWRSTLRW